MHFFLSSKALVVFCYVKYQLLKQRKKNGFLGLGNLQKALQGPSKKKKIYINKLKHQCGVFRADA